MINTATIITLVGPVVALLALDLVVRLIRRSRRPDRQRLAEQAREVAIRLAAEEQERAETAEQEQERRIA